MKENYKSEKIPRKSLFAAIIAAALSHGEVVLAQDTESLADITFTELSQEELQALPVHESIHKFADKFYIAEGVGNLEGIMEKAFSTGLTAQNRTALTDDEGHSIMVRNFVRHQDGECIVGIRLIDQEAGTAEYYSKTPEICDVDVMYFDKQDFLS